MIQLTKNLFINIPCVLRFLHFIIFLRNRFQSIFSLIKEKLYSCQIQRVMIFLIDFNSTLYIGTSAGHTSIEDFVTIKPDQRNASKTFLGLPKEMIYATVRCTNGAGLTHTCSSDGVKLVQKPPSVDNVILELLTTSTTQYEPRDHYHGNNTEIRFRWTGFKTDDGVKSYLVK
jgi:hypothetical protein